MHVQLYTPQGDYAGDLDWDEDEQQLTGGTLREEVQPLLDSVLARGWLVTHPYPTSYTVPQPSTAEQYNTALALVLGKYWKVPPQLTQFYPVADAGPPVPAGGHY